MAEPNVNKLYDKLIKFQKKLEEAKQIADELAADSQQVGGEVARVMNSQLIQYTIPPIEKILSSEDSPGGVIPLFNFLDSVPLGLVRSQTTEPQAHQAHQEKRKKESIQFATAENRKNYYVGRRV